MILTNKIQRLLFLILLLFKVFSGSAQSPEKQQATRFSDNKSTFTQSEKLLEQARFYSSSDREKSVEFYIQALEFINGNFEKAVVLDTIGLYNWQLGNYDEALFYFNKAILLFNDLKDSTWLGKVNNNIAVVNWGLGNSNEALKYYHIALKIRKANNDQRGISTILNNIGQIYSDWGLYSEAMKYHNKALEIALEIDDKDAIAYSYSNVGNCYKDLNNLETALEYYYRGYEILLEKDENNRSNSLFSANIGNVYSKMNKLDSALLYFQKSLEYAHRINNMNRIATAEYNMGSIFLKTNKIKSADYYINLSYQHSLEKNYSALIKDNLFALSEIEEKRGNQAKALQLFKAASELKDSLFNKEKILKLTDLQIKFNLEQEQNENLLLRKNNEIQQVIIQKHKSTNLILIIGSLLIFIVLGFMIRSIISLKKLSLKLENSEKKLLAANADKDKFFTIIAHDLKSPFNGFLGITEILATQFNELSGERVQTLINALKDSALKMYALLEGLLQWAQIQSGKMNYNFEPLNLFEKVNKVTALLATNSLDKKIDISNRVDKNAIVFADQKSVETVLRNLISNAIKFTNPGGFVSIESEVKAEEIVVSISDNGVGMSEKAKNNLFRIAVNPSTSGTNNESGTGLGLILCKELIENNKGEIKVESEPGKGSTFIFTLPLKRL